MGSMYKYMLWGADGVVVSFFEDDEVIKECVYLTDEAKELEHNIKFTCHFPKHTSCYVASS